MRRQRGMALLDSLMALLALSVGLTPMVVLPGQTERALAENTYRSWMLWQSGNLAEALLLVDVGDDGRRQLLARQARRDPRTGECGALSFKLSRVAGREPSTDTDSLRLQASGCHAHRQRIELLVPLP